MKRRILTAAFVILGIVFASGLAAWAYFSATSTATQLASSSTLTAPASASAVAASSTSITVTVASGPSSPSPAASGYNVYADGTTSPTLCTISGNTGSCTISGLAVATNYSFDIYSTLSNWISATSTTVSATTDKATPTITTTPSAGVGIGGTVSDQATLTSSFNPTGSIVFTLYSNSACTTSVFTSTNAISSASATSGNFTTTAQGTFYWKAVYAGDANNTGFTTPCGTGQETVAVAQATTGITTTPSAGVGIGGTVSDQATLTSSFNPTGSIVFTLYSNSACTTSVFTSTNAISSASATSGNFTTTAQGTFYWKAVYAGDANNTGFTTPCGTGQETVVVGKDTTGITTTPSAGVTVGGTVSDQATLTSSFNPTGSIVFTLYSNSACTTQVFTSTNAISGTSATSGNFTTTAAGTFYWKAVYAGDANNTGFTTPCGTGQETVVVGKDTTGITTTPSAGVTVGGTVSDQATLTSSFNPTGSIVFTLYSNSACTTQVFTSTNAISGTSATSGNFTTTAAGTFYWKAVYAGDANNTGFTTPCGTGQETVVVGKDTTGITTTPSAGVTVGGTVSDQATLTSSFNPTGSIVFTLYSNSACTTQVFTSTNAISGTSATSGNFTTTAAGTFYWKAVYAGDANNTGFTTPCGTGQETVAVAQATTGITTTPSAGVGIGGTVSDQATLTSSFNPTGSIVFTLYSNSACTTSVFTSTNAISSASATSGNFTTTAQGTFYWKAVYAGDANNTGFTTPCGTGQETVAVAQATTGITTTPSAGVTVGGTVSDQATLTSSFNPTGSIVFTLYSNSACTTQVFTSTNAISGTSATSGNFTTTAAGTFYWKAVYAGDANNTGFTTPCGTGQETVVVGKDTTGITTTPSAGVTVGGTVSDQATLTSSFNPTGSIVFTLYSNSACTTSVFTSTNAISSASATSGNFTTTAQGTFYWKAVYAGDANNTGFTTPCGTGQETVAVAQATTGITTTPSAGVGIGGTVSDQATLTSSFNPTGSIVFTLYSNSACTTSVFTSTNAISSASATSGNFTTTAQGTFYWKAVYAGDANNTGFTTPCGTGQETVVVGKDSPTITATGPGTGTAGTAIAASAISSLLSGGTTSPAVSGTITFTVFGPQSTAPTTCTSGGTTVGTATVSGNNTYHPSAGFTPSSGGDYWWYASYGGDSNNNTATSTCGSGMSLTVVPYSGGSNGNLSNGTFYYNINAIGTGSSTKTANTITPGVGQHLLTLTFNLTTSSGTAHSATVGVVSGGVWAATALTCTINPGSTSCTSTGSVSITSAESINLEVVANGNHAGTWSLSYSQP